MRKLMLLFVCVLLTACNMPAAEANPDDLNQQAATFVALTMQAQPTVTLENTPFSTPMPSTPTSTGTATATITPTYSVPMLTLSENTNCRTGPGQAFDVLITLLPGASVEILGIHPSENYWVVKVQGMEQPCWLWGEYATPSGSHWAVPSMTPPPTATPSPPAAPTNLQYTFFCTLTGEVTTTITWNDAADNEQGYRVFYNGELVTELPANSKSYTETISIDPGDELIYSIYAFGATGVSAQKSISFTCQ